MLYLALDDGAPRFPQGSSDPMVLGKSLRPDTRFDYGALTHFGRPSQTVRLHDQVPYRAPATPAELLPRV
jgi:hypothetical protein